MENWLTVIIVLLIVGIALDGVRRMRLARKESIRLSKNAEKADLEDDVQVSSSEFPSGGARVAGYRDEEHAHSLNENVRKNYEAKRVTRGSGQKIPEQVSLNLEETVPMLMDSVEQPEQDEDNEHANYISEDNSEPAIGTLEGLNDGVDEPEFEPQTQQINDYQDSSSYEDTETYDEAPAQEDEVEQGQQPDEVLIINVMAKTGMRFAGEDLLAILMKEGLKFGDMDIFHRHKDNDGDAPIIFSLANMVVPGTFNLSAMQDFQTPGVSLFLSLPVAGDSIAAYDDMSSTARNIAAYLDGELKDENRSVMTSQTIEHGRQRVIEYERKKKLAHA